MWSMRVSMLVVTVVVKSHANVRMPEAKHASSSGSGIPLRMVHW